MKNRILITLLVSLLAVAMVIPMAIPVGANGGLILAARWNFNDGSGPTALDMTANNNDATLKGTFGNALLFDGVNDYVSVGDSGSLDITGPITLEAWIKPLVIPVSGDKVIVSKWNHNAPPQRSYYLTIRDKKLSFYLSPDTVNYMTLQGADMTPYIGQWVHVAATFDGATAKLYINGVDQLITSTTTGIYSSSSPLYIGSYLPTDLRTFNGAIDEVRISNIARTSFDLGSPPTADADTVAMWHFNEGSGQETADSAGTNDIGQLGSTNGIDVNDPGWIGSGIPAAGPQWVAGKYDGALSFDGIDDFAVASGSPSLYITDKLTVEAWIKPTGLPGRIYGDPVRLGTGYELCLRPDGKLEIALFRGGSWSWFDSIGTIPLSSTRFYHVAFTYDKDAASNNLKIYIDEVLDAQFSTTGALQPSGSFYIGHSYWVFKGLIDELRIWNSVLDASQLDDMDPPAINISDFDVIPLGTVLTATDGGTGVKIATVAVDGGAATDIGIGFTLPAGIHTLTINATDYALNTLPSTVYNIVVYDPSAGFVTGGGWINSPAGAYVADPSLVGKATFGFVSKYVKGKTEPTGNTEFQFQAGNLNFKSTSYDWLVVNQNDSNAQFKGIGSVNGVDGYKFMLWATDGSPDTFRIKIWSGEDTVVYDNGVEQAIAQGSIVVHKGK